MSIGVVREEDEPQGYLDEEPADDEETEEPVDEFAEFEPEVAERLRGIIREKEQAVSAAARQQVRDGLQAYGMDLTDDNQPAIRDPLKAGGWVGGMLPAVSHQPSVVSAGPTADSRQPTAEDDPIPDPVMDPAGFNRWQDKRMAAALVPYQQALAAAQQRSAETAIEITMAKVPGAVQNSRFADLLTHPEFEVRMRQALASVDPEQWKDSRNLVRIAGMIAIDLDGTLPVTPRAVGQPRDSEGRFSEARPADPRAVGRQALSRATLPQSAPSRDSGREPKGTQPSDIDRAIAERLGISAEEAALLRQDTTGDASAALRKKRLERMKR